MDEKKDLIVDWKPDADMDMIDKICQYFDQPAGKKWMEVREKMLKLLNALIEYELEHTTGLQLHIEIIANSDHPGWCVDFVDESAGYTEGGSEEYERVERPGTSSPRLGSVMLRLPKSSDEGIAHTKAVFLRGEVVGSAFIPKNEEEERLIVALQDPLQTTLGVKLNFIVVRSKHLMYFEDLDQVEIWLSEERERK